LCQAGEPALAVEDTQQETILVTQLAATRLDSTSLDARAAAEHAATKKTAKYAEN